ncbi:SDR family NAD(P)-dependent oxidoreductase [Chloroflexota bacterium]
MSMSNLSLSLEGKVAIVTGAGTGIGQAVALDFARAGADVIVAGRRLPLLEQVTEEIETLGRRSLAVKTDVSQKTDVDNLFAGTIDKFGRVDILVNNAGILSGKSVLESTEDEWDRIIDIDLKGCYLCCQAVSGKMIEQRQGNIINVASLGGVSTCGGVSVGVYGIAKAGVIRLTRGLAWELGQYNIRVNAIAPGIVVTEMTRDVWTDPEKSQQRAMKRPMPRLTEADEIATIALFLASDASSTISGQTIIADCGEIA